MRNTKTESGVIHRVILAAFCCLSLLGSLSEGKNGKHIPSALIIGTVRKAGQFISGASVKLECGNGISLKQMFRKEAKTNEHGEFRVHLPASVSKHLKSIKVCSVKLMSCTEPDCAVASSTSTTLVHLNSRKDKGSPRVFSAGLLTFSPLKQSSLCGQKRNLQAITNTIPIAEQTQQFLPHFSTFIPVLKPSTIPQLPPLPQLQPLPALPSLPKLREPQLRTPKPVEEKNHKPNVIDQKSVPSTFLFPFPPNPFQPPVLPPNPLLPPPSIFPPVPGLTPPPSGILPPVPGLTPPPSSILPPVPGLTPPPSGIFPPIPGLTPPPPTSIFPPFPGIPTVPGVPTIPGFPKIPGLASPPPPPPPLFFPPFPFPFPFPPGFPGVPPAASMSSVKP